MKFSSCLAAFATAARSTPLHASTLDDYVLPTVSHSGGAEAVEADRTNVETYSYSRTFFDRFFPQTALELLERVPGFAVESGNDLRGFAGGAGNVLINGQKPYCQIHLQIPPQVFESNLVGADLKMPVENFYYQAGSGEVFFDFGTAPAFNFIGQ